MPVNWQFGIAVAIGLAASLEDLLRRRISNWIPLAALLAGLVYQSARHGWRGAGASLLGAAGGFAVFLVFYVLGGMGGGDVKLMAGFGALVGLEGLLPAALWTAACGGLLALGVLAWRAVIRPPRRKAASPGQGEYIPYAPAIAMGVWLSLVPTS